MSTDKMKLVIESLVEIMKSHTKEFKKANKRLLKSIDSDVDDIRMADVMTEAIVGSIKVMDAWEDTALNELDGLTPKQYFESLSNVNEIIELYTLIGEKNGSLLPSALIDRVKQLENAVLEDVLIILDSIKLDDSKCLNITQIAVIQIAETLENPNFISPLLKVASQLDDEKSDEDTYNRIMDAIRAIGEPALNPLIDLVSKGEKGRLYNYLILTVGKIASHNKSEQIYKLLKDLFRKSDKKYIEANALGIYGDSRAIPAIRGYVEKYIEDLSYWEYLQFKEAVLLLDGNMHDLDHYFDNYDNFYEFETS